MALSSVSAPKSKVLRAHAEECRTMAALFHGEKTRAVLMRVATEYERMADQAAMLELQEADRNNAIVPAGTSANRLV